MAVRLPGPDEWGEPHTKPIFSDLADSGKAFLFKDDILVCGATDVFADKVITVIDQTLGQEHPFKFHRYGMNIDATMIEKSPTEKFIFLINNETKQATIDIEMTLPEGNYEVFARDENQWYRVSIGASETLSNQSLGKFRVLMPREKPYILYIRKSL